MTRNQAFKTSDLRGSLSLLVVWRVKLLSRSFESRKTGEWRNGRVDLGFEAQLRTEAGTLASNLRCWRRHDAWRIDLLTTLSQASGHRVWNLVVQAGRVS